MLFFEVRFPGLSPTEIVNSVLQRTTIRTVLELCETVGREGLCSFNECVCCIAFTALFTFLDHMEILLHYILTKSSVWLGGRERGGGESEPEYVYHAIQSCLMGK